MNNKQPGNINTRQNNTNDEAINIRAFLIKYRLWWPLFVVSILIALSIAFIYTIRETPAYEIMATMMIQSDNSQPPEQKSSLVEFQSLEQVNAPKVVENEIEVLKSNQLIRNVVNYFQLWADYELKGGIIKNRDLYGISPVKINLLDAGMLTPSPKIDLLILDTSSYLLLDKKGNSAKHRFNDTIKNALGSWTISKNASIVHYIGDEIEIGITDPETTTLAYQNALTVEAQEKPATVINISLSDPNVRKGEDFINYLIYFYKRSDITEKSKITKSTLDFIDKRLDSISGQLNYTENSIEGYRSHNGLTDVNAQSQMYLQGIQSNNEKLNEINVQLHVIENLEAYLDKPGNNDSSIPSAIGISDQHLSALIQKLSDLELERDKMLATLPEKNPAFDPINSQIASLKQEIKEDIKSMKSSLTTMQGSLASFKSNIQSSIKNVPVQEQQLSGMGRQQSTKSSLYNYLLQQRETIALTYASSASEVRLVDAAHTLPLKAAKKIMPFGIAFLIGLIFPAGFIYSRDIVKYRVGSRKEIEQATGIPVIAEFSYIKLPSAIVFENRANQESFALIEQFRHLRTQLNLLNESIVGGYFVLVTSSVANEGKSMVSSNLAVSLASIGKKTLLIETDIYKPTISKTFGLAPLTGLTSYLTNQAFQQDIVQEVPSYPNLSIIGSGPFVDNFSELLEQESFLRLISAWRVQYDYILFDSPPVHAINDAHILAKFCDVTLYVVRHNYTSKSLLPFIRKLNSNECFQKMNIIYNGLKNGRDSEGYKYEHYSREATR
ncbi:capsular exopolysaccharide synthesis family protein [Mucilaginibacter frigoritolerans]|jgi:tyrosine-protein kinase Etk/Wzc|uniref:non-specific protein-tyrosine kinase n=1 Tax=Mucilaginibacter frigoritolerans TaxID=652788 RepID=A0A562U4M0_9SPHI|nr:polysaccharide biosynthesis tyrosine autokinase [Mucilaginibacter frigoritolerans]TWJ00644.1 capsular exopolysaccharide synthesis family protein [Mucilaginibacter frigoritolerans]